MEKEYKKNFIANFIVRFDFETYSDTFDMDKILKIFKKTYPLVIKNNIQDHQIVIDKNSDKGTPRIEPTNMIHEISMSNSEQTTRIKISNLAFVYETTRYTKFSKIKEELIDVLNVLEKEVEIKNYARFGIRYINLIKLPCKSKSELLNWDKYINEKLLQSQNLFNDKNEILQSIQINNIKSNFNEEIIYTIQTGIPNRNFPASLMEKNYLIDIDGYSKSLMQKEDVIALFDDVHNEQKIIFENCIKDELRRYMDE